MSDDNSGTRDSQDLDQIAKDWIELQYQFARNDAPEAGLDVLSAMDAIRQQQPGVFLDLVRTINRLDSSDLISSNLAAGPLEDLLSQHGDALIDRIESIAASDFRFRELFSAVWSNSMAPEVWDRVQKLSRHEH